MAGFTIPTIPGELAWKNDPTDWAVETKGGLRATAPGQTDWFIAPDGSQDRRSAPLALFAAGEGDFTFQARVTVGFASTFDAGVLMVYAEGDRWGKLCFEYSPQGKPMVVSVVTKGVSDDCNSVVIDGSDVCLRISRTGQTFAFHYSTDGSYWNMARYFTLGEVSGLQAGLSAQCPTGESCTVTFDDIRYERRTIENIRNGE